VTSWYPEAPPGGLVGSVGEEYWSSDLLTSDVLLPEWLSWASQLGAGDPDVFRWWSIATSILKDFCLLLLSGPRSQLDLPEQSHLPTCFL
jgi:hypothetical protein